MLVKGATGLIGKAPFNCIDLKSDRYGDKQASLKYAYPEKYANGPCFILFSDGCRRMVD